MPFVSTKNDGGYFADVSEELGLHDSRGWWFSIEAADFDNDGDMDFCLLATFPDYDKQPLLPFVYLKNEDPGTFEFSTELLNNPTLGRWLLAEAGDIDQDGDQDIILSSFTYVFTPVPDSLNAKWNNTGIDLMILRNKSSDDN